MSSLFSLKFTFFFWFLSLAVMKNARHFSGCDSQNYAKHYSLSARRDCTKKRQWTSTSSISLFRNTYRRNLINERNKSNKRQSVSVLKWQKQWKVQQLELRSGIFFFIYSFCLLLLNMFLSKFFLYAWLLLLLLLSDNIKFANTIVVSIYETLWWVRDLCLHFCSKNEKRFPFLWLIKFENVKCEQFFFFILSSLRKFWKGNLKFFVK